MEDSRDRDQPQEPQPDGGLLIDLSPSELDRSLHTDHGSASRENTSEDEYDLVADQIVNTPTNEERTFRFKRQPKTRKRIGIPDYQETLQPMKQPEPQDHSPMQSMKLMMDQMSLTMKAFQEMMQATTLTMQQVYESSQRQSRTKINTNNNKSRTEDLHNVSQVDSDGESDLPVNNRSSMSNSTERLFDQTPKTKLDCKLPPYTGSEKWKVWLNRFESVAKLSNWTSREKLQQLLPRIQGNAADFVFGQLKESTIASYEGVVAEIESRFGITENKRIYKMQFNNKRQGKGEGLEEYAADIKRLYDWAHPNRDASTRQEDLVAKFLQGLWDSRARQYIELHRDPSTIEEATQQVAAYLSITHNVDTYDDRHHVRQAKPDNKKGNAMTQQKPTEWKQKGSCFICGVFLVGLGL